MEACEEIKKENKVLRIFMDESPENPREWGNLGIIAYKHDRYNLGEEKINDPIEWLEDKLNLENKGIYTDERLKELETLFFKKFIGLELYLYEHSGISISCSPFGCRWDSGKIGYIYTTKEKAKEEGLNKQKCLKLLEGEVKTFNEYLTGEVYGFTLIEEIPIKQTTITEYPDGNKEKSIINTTEEKELDSCWGFYGDEGIKQIKEENGF